MNMEREGKMGLELAHDGKVHRGFYHTLYGKLRAALALVDFTQKHSMITFIFMTLEDTV